MYNGSISGFQLKNYRPFLSRQNIREENPTEDLLLTGDGLDDLRGLFHH